MAQNDDGSMSRDSPAPDGGDSARDQAIRQLERKRKFHAEAIGWAIVMVVLVAVWAMSEYHNAGGWPTEGLSQVPASTMSGTTGSSTRSSPICCSWACVLGRSTATSRSRRPISRTRDGPSVQGSPIVVSPRTRG